MSNADAPKTETPPPAPAPTPPASEPAHAPEPAAAHSHPTPDAPKKSGPWKWIILAAVVVLAAIFGIPWVQAALSTVSTDDAFVNGHVTFAAPRVPGQVVKVLVDDNNRVRKGDLLVQLDPQPYQVLVDVAQSAVVAAQADLNAADAQAHAITGQMRSLRFVLQHAMEDVANQVALLKSRTAALESQKAVVVNARMDYDRVLPLLQANAVTQEEVDHRKQAMLVAQAKLEEALQAINQTRVSLGLAPKLSINDDMTEVPPDLDQTFSTVRQAQASLQQAAAQLGYFASFGKTPKEMIADFYKQDPDGNLDRIYAKLIKEAPAVKQAEAKVLQAQRNLDQAKLNLSYCDIFSEIDGVVTRRNVNPGNNIVVGQSLMAVRSLTEVWIDANFKETQLAELKIGQNVDLDVDMYGSRKRFKGRISGFTFGTGSTLALLPAENATGNFVKVVQRLPVRIELIDYNRDTDPLFVGLSVTPIVRIKEPPSGPDAGKFLQPHLQASQPVT